MINFLEQVSTNRVRRFIVAIRERILPTTLRYSLVARDQSDYLLACFWCIRYETYVTFIILSCWSISTANQLITTPTHASFHVILHTIPSVISRFLTFTPHLNYSHYLRYSNYFIFNVFKIFARFFQPFAFIHYFLLTIS